MLKYMPLYGSILLTIIILWIVGSTIVGNRRKIRQAAAGRYYRSTCCGSTSTPLGWTADGWVSRCDDCGTWQYHGDDFDNPPAGFADRHAQTLRNYEAELQHSRPVPAPRPTAASGPDVEGAIGVRPTANRRDGWDRIRSAFEPEVTSEKALELRDDYRRTHPEIASVWDDDEGEPLAIPPQPNLGGEGNPEYKGPHYAVEHDRFVPYDVLRDPPEGAAVHIVGNVACVGPLEVEEGQGDDNDVSDRTDADDQA